MKRAINNTVDMSRKLSEERTRKEMIDPQLEMAGWYLRDHAKVKTEIPVDGYDAEPWNGEVLAVVEATEASGQSLFGRIGESERQVEGLFESLLSVNCGG